MRRIHCAWIGVFLFLLGCAPAGPRVARNPYDGLDWDTLEVHKANLHTHTTESDGRLSPQEVVDLYAQAGYSILALTDHDTHPPEASTWPWKAYGIDVEASGMLPIHGNEISGPDHIGSYFIDYGDAQQRSVPAALEEIGDRGGLAVMFHPGRYRHLRTPEWYMDLYRDFPHLVGMEVFNQNDRYPGDRAIYDAVLGGLMPDRPVWAMANDDFHRMEHFARSFNLFLLPPGGRDEANFRRAFEAGRFHAVHNPSRDTSHVIVPDRIVVTPEAIEVVVDCRDDQVVWISHGHEIHRGRRLPLSTNLGDYVRAVLEGEAGTQTLLQPFGLTGTGDRAMTDLTVAGGQGSGEYLAGSRHVRIRADTAPSGEIFVGWTGDVEQVADVRAPETAIRRLSGQTVHVEAAYRPAEPQPLTVRNGRGSGPVPEEAYRQIAATVPEGRVFEVWTGDVEWVESPRSPVTRFRMPQGGGDMTVTATFAAEATFAPQLRNPSFQDGADGWQAKPEDVRPVRNEDGTMHLAVLRRSGIMQRVDGMDVQAGQRLTLYFEARIAAPGRDPLGFVGMQLLSDADEELVASSITVRDEEWTPLAVSGEVTEGVVAPNIFVWMRDGELHLRNFRLRIHESGR